jgi:putative toxin-antitoxin system antitoxin component (TIGR02293 family)
MSRKTGYDDTELAMVTVQPIVEVFGLGASVRTMQDLDSIVTAGLPKRSLVPLSSRLYSDNKVASAFKFKVAPVATWKRRTKRLSPLESERIERLARVLAAAEYALDDREEARQWISSPHRELGCKTPLETAQSEIGARRVESVLNKLFYGLPA